eukprot:5272018-Pleurochrysis_carterae.AAC.2
MGERGRRAEKSNETQKSKEKNSSKIPSPVSRKPSLMRPRACEIEVYKGRERGPSGHDSQV